MASYVSDSAQDAKLAYIRDNATTQILLDAQPADRAAALANSLGSVALVSGDFTISNGDTSGRKVTVAAKNGVAITANGNYNHVAVISGTELLLVATGTTQALTSGDNVNIPAWDYESRDPA